MIICLCGSSRFGDEFRQVNLDMTLEGHVVLTIGCDTKSDTDLFANMSPQEIRLLKAKLDVLHFKKIDMADLVYIINKGGYIGESTEREIEYAKMRNKHIQYMEPLMER